MNKYEVMYIVDPKLTDEDVQKIADKYKKVITDQKGTVSKAEKWEKRKLAYEINDFQDGNYILMEFESNPDAPKELDRVMRINDEIIRHRIFRQDEVKQS